jgi:hypothetical protein
MMQKNKKVEETLHPKPPSGAFCLDIDDIFGGMTKEEVALSLKHTVSIGQMKREGKSKLEIECEVRRVQEKYQRELRALHEKMKKDKGR